MPAPIRIHLLGHLEVRRPDGVTVAPGAFRTTKTSDLLRILALNNGRLVCRSTVMERLWPDAPEDRAGASLRTAASQIRQALGVNCVIRHPGALELQGAWVDVDRFAAGVRDVQKAARAGRHERVIAIADAAERHYRGDLFVQASSDWAMTSSEELIHSRHGLLETAAESANTVGRFREAMDFATKAVRIDPVSETAHRALMLAHAEMGEIGSALRVFESFRKALAEELGATPSAQTQDLHLSLLRNV